jgi:hypothetical protein
MRFLALRIGPLTHRHDAIGRNDSCLLPTAYCLLLADFVAEVVDQKSTVSAWSFDAVYCTCAFWWPGL